MPLRRDTRVFEALASPRMGWLAYLVALFVGLMAGAVLIGVLSNLP